MSKKTLQRMCTMCIPQRYVLSIMCLIGMANTYIMRGILNFAITQMVKAVQVDSVDYNYCPADETVGNVTKATGEFDWSEEKQGLILSAFYYGYILTHIPGGLLSQKFGGKVTLGIGILCTAIFSLLTPVVAYMGAWPLIILRFLMGVGEGMTFPAVSTLLAQWAPPLERSKMTSLCFAGVQLGMVIAAALGGIMLKYFSWPNVFYIFGTLSVIWYFFWCLLCYKDPASHPFISDKEKDYITKTLGQTEQRKDLPPTPWGQMFKSKHLWALIIAQIGHDWCVYTMMTDLPKYMNDVMKFNIAQNGLLSALPYLALWLTSLTAGALGDWIIQKKFMSVTNLRKLMSTLSTVLPALGVILASYSGCDRTLVTILFTCGMGAVGFFYAALPVNSLDLSPNYAGSIMALVNGSGSVSGMIAPYVLGLLTPNRSLVEWRKAFWLMFVMLVGTNFVFMFFASGEVQPWNEPSRRETEDGERKVNKLNECRLRFISVQLNETLSTVPTA